MQTICRFRPVFAILLVFFIMASFTEAQELEDVIFLKGTYQNTSGSNACTLFSGNAENPPDSPNNGTSYLIQSAIGWPTPATKGWVNPDAPGLPGEPKDAAESLAQEGYQYLRDIQTLFHSYYQNDDPKNPESIYLGFDWFTNHIMNSDGIGQVIIDGELYDPDALFDEESASKAQQHLFMAFNMNPYLEYPIDDTSVDLRYLLLDIPYYQSVALMMQGNLALERAFCARFFEELRSSGAVINDELEMLGWNIAVDDFSEQGEQGAWEYFSKASQVWLDLFASPIRRAYLLEFAPVRTLDYRNHPAFKDTDRPAGLIPEDSEWPPIVYEGYKDVATMLRALAQRARAVHEVAWRLVLKLEREQAAELVEKYVQEISLEEGVIMSMFFPDGLPEDHESKYPGVAESSLALRDAVAQLGTLREAAVNERLNALGFDKDVLFIRSVEPGGTDRTAYTYDWLKNRLLSSGTDPIGALGSSFTDDETAKRTRKNFDLKASSYLSEFDSIKNEYDQQLIAICGSNSINEPNLDDPLSGGGQLSQQKTNIEVALNAIERVKRQMENVESRIEIERDRVAKVNGVSDKRIRIINETTGEIAHLTEEIAEIQAQMAIANAAAQAAASIGLENWGWGAAAHAANGFVQAEMHRRMGKKQAAIVRLQGEQQAKFEYLNQEINDINSEAQIKTWFLELRTLEIDMYDAEIRYTQELKRLAQLYNDIENKIMRRERAKDRLTRRSFADPTYRIEVTNAALKAEDSFRVAQIWVWFMAKALEYKWPLGRQDLRLTFQEILMARTADKLKTLVDNMRTYDMTQQGNPPGASYYYWSYSLRKDYLGMTFEKENAEGNTLSAVEQFQTYLTELKNDSENIVSVDGSEYLSVPFSTVKFDIRDEVTGSESIPDSEGASHLASATPIFQSGLWDSKIDWVQVSIEGNRIYTDPEQMEIFLWYGGSGFVRTRDNFTASESPGTDLDFLVFSNPAYTFSYAKRGFGWNVLPYIRQKMAAKLGTVNTDIPDYVFKNEAFRERPVASTDWRLLIPVDGTNLENIRDIKINILYTARTRQYRR